MKEKDCPDLNPDSLRIKATKKKNWFAISST
jgi:hypothetical protein